MTNKYAIYEKSFRYRGGYPDLPKLASGTVVVFRTNLKYIETRWSGLKEAFVILAEAIVEARAVEVKGFLGTTDQAVEVDVAPEQGEAFTVTLTSTGTGGGAKKDVLALLEAIETIQAETGTGPAVMVRTYKSDIDYQQDARRLAKHGYTVQSTAHHENRPGAVRIATLGLGALVWKPKASLVVTYRKEEAA